ncbi:MAG TPA: hypothetical protein VGY56_21830 [Verrucomicrobiae bacterium]|nr:hypothetical protein [Verrucomicrobiae bacterium]
MDENEPPYRTQSTDRNVQVVDETGRVVLNCGDSASAEQYAVLLNQAFQRGFKAGSRSQTRLTRSGQKS